MNKLILFLLKYYLLFFVTIIFFINPIFPYGYFIGGRSVLALILAPWWLISFYLLFQVNLMKKRNLFFLVGIIVSYFYYLLSFALEERSSDILRLSYTIAFISIPILLYKINPTDNEIKRWSLFIDIAGLLLIIYAFSVSYGLIPFPFEYTITIGEKRFTFDATVGSISFLSIWFTNRLFSSTGKGMYILYSSVIILGLLRILASSTRGILVGTIVGVFIMILLSMNKKNIKKFIAYTVSILMISILFLSVFEKNDLIEKTFSTVTTYIALIEGRGTETGISRVVEALADFDTLAEYPLLGAGFQVAGMKVDSFGSSSSGHFFLTGTLARFGIFGLIGFMIIYILFFKSLNNRCPNSKCRRKLYAFYALIIFYLIFGNPLYLFPQWPGVAFILYVFINLDKGKKCLV